MPAIIDCPACSRKVRVPDSLFGQVVRCPLCTATFPAGDGSREDPPAPALLARGPVAAEDRTQHRGAAGANYQAEAPVAPYRMPSPDGDLSRPAPAYDAAPLKPGKAHAIGIMMLLGGIVALLVSVGWGAGSLGFCFLWPGLYYGVVVGILAIVKGSALLGDRAYLEAEPKTVAVLQIINIINGDVANCVLGIIALVFLNDDEVKGYFRG